MMARVKIFAPGKAWARAAPRPRGWKWAHSDAIRGPMSQSPTSTAPETVSTPASRVSCDGAGDIRTTGPYRASALGHPRVWLEIDERGFVDCPYCDKRFVLQGDGGHGH